MTRSTGPIPKVTPEEVREIQQLLTRAGHDVGGADGKVGISTRAAIKAMQMKFGLPADSYPSPELLARLRTGRWARPLTLKEFVIPRESGESSTPCRRGTIAWSQGYLIARLRGQ